jgi:hypothetical protein
MGPQVLSQSVETLDCNQDTFLDFYINIIIIQLTSDPK